MVLAAMAPIVALKTVNLRRVLLTLVLLDLPMQWDIHLGHRDDVAALGALGGWNISVTTLCLALLYAEWLTGFLTRTTESRLRFRLSWPLLVYFAFGVLSLAAATDVGLALYELFLLGQMLLLHVYIASTVRTRGELVYIVTFLLVGFVLEGVISGALILTGDSLAIGGVEIGRVDTFNIIGNEGIRVGGTMAWNVAGAYFSVLLTFACAVLLSSLGRGPKALAVAGIGLGIPGLVYTFSRGGWLAFGISFTLLCVPAWRAGWVPRRLGAALPVVPLLAALVFVPSIVDRMRADDRGAAYSRIPLMQLGADIIQDHPLIGVGANNFAIVMHPYVTSRFAGEWIYTVHNKYLLVWAETGIGGLTAFLLFLAVTLRRGWQCWQRSDPLLSPLALGIAAGILGQMAHMFFDLFSARPQVQLLWVMAALITAMHNMRTRPDLRPGT
jgi:hypothetical protein